MKNSIIALSLFSVGVFGLSSCYSPKFMVDDDVYVVRPNDVPIGESLNDETAYSNFKNNKRNGVGSNYSNDYYLVNNSFSSTLFFSSMFGMNNGWYRPGGFPIYYNSHFGFSYDPYNSYYGYYNPYGGYNPYYNSYYVSYMGYNPYGYGYGYGYGSYNSWANNNYGGNTTVAYNQTNGPRGSITGGFGSANRGETLPKVKSSTLPSNTGGAKTPVRVTNGDFVGRNVHGSSTTTTTTSGTTPVRTVTGPVAESRGCSSTGTSTGSSGTTVSSRSNASNLQSTENRGVTHISNSSGSTYSGGRGTYSSGSGSGGGRTSTFDSGSDNTISPSRSSGSSGSSSGGSSGGSRSGGSSSGSSSGGRRP